MNRQEILDQIALELGFAKEYSELGIVHYSDSHYKADEKSFDEKVESINALIEWFSPSL